MLDKICYVEHGYFCNTKHSRQRSAMLDSIDYAIILVQAVDKKSTCLSMASIYQAELDLTNYSDLGIRSNVNRTDSWFQLYA